MSNIKMLVIKNGFVFDMSELVSEVKWSGRRGAAARTLSVTFIDDDGYRHERTKINVEDGNQCIFYWKGKELFRGIFMKQEQSKSKVLSATAYDSAIYLANNKDTFNYTNAKASDIFIDCCKRFGIPYGDVADTLYKIPELPKPKTTAWDVICDALSLTYKATGIRYYPACINGEMRFFERRENVLQWVIETGVNLESYTLTKSIENLKTRIKLFSKEGAVIAEAFDAELEKKVGIFQDVSQINDAMNLAQLNELVKTTLEETNKPEQLLTVSALGMPDVTTGIGVFVIIKELDISKTYYVEEDSHTFQGNYHTMQLKLTFATDISKPKLQDKATVTTEEAGQSNEIKIGDIVYFTGGYHYITSTIQKPSGVERTAGLAKCKHIEKGTPHPYYILGTTSSVCGWVDADKVSKKEV